MAKGCWQYGYLTYCSVCGAELVVSRKMIYRAVQHRESQVCRDVIARRRREEEREKDPTIWVREHFARERRAALAHLQTLIRTWEKELAA